MNQTINFGLPSPIDIQIIGLKQDENRVYAKKLMQRLKKVPGLVDIREHQAMNYPELFVDIDRSKAKELGITQRNIAMSLFIALSGSFQTSPTFWLSPENNVSYPLVVQAPQYVMNSLQALRNIMIDGISPNIQSPAQHQILGALGTITRKWTSVVESHYNVMPVIDIFAATQDRDLGSITHDINQIIAEMNSEVPLGSTIAIRGQIDTQHQAFQGLYWGIVFSVLLIYLLIVINFQSWVDPFIIITALPAAIAGIAWFLFITCTTLSVPALTGAIMCMGVATSNSILIISFARQHLLETNNPLLAAMEAGRTRIRPVLMTASAMIIGMMPMALGLGDGGEQNAPLGRAVIGGLSFATIATLFFVPTVFYIIHNHQLKVKQRNNHA
ncbi:efflux RND transporter permease subunit [Legionella pneumophila]|uniref:efflux RND transporter permease subunit n=1 Tax=Legionella pneumophila TaxID=446 RepID=UPI003EE986E6